MTYKEDEGKGKEEEEEGDDSHTEREVAEKEPVPDQTLESSSDLMARLTKFIYNYQGKEFDRLGVHLIELLRMFVCGMMGCGLWMYVCF